MYAKCIKYYQQWICDIKELVHVSQLKAAVQVNTEMIRMYWHIGKDLFYTMGTSCFDKQLPALQSDLAKEVIKDPYSFDFLTLTEGYREKELEDALTNNNKILIRVGAGICLYW